MPNDGSNNRPDGAAKKADAAVKVKSPKSKSGAKSGEREARLAEALRANLRRRKTSPAGDGATDKKDD